MRDLSLLLWMEEILHQFYAPPGMYKTGAGFLPSIVVQCLGWFHTMTPVLIMVSALTTCQYRKRTNVCGPLLQIPKIYDIVAD